MPWHCRGPAWHRHGPSCPCHGIAEALSWHCRLPWRCRIKTYGTRHGIRHGNATAMPRHLPRHLPRHRHGTPQGCPFRSWEAEAVPPLHCVHQPPCIAIPLATAATTLLRMGRRGIPKGMPKYGCSCPMAVPWEIHGHDEAMTFFIACHCSRCHAMNKSNG